MRVAIISGICVPHDAISNAMAAQAELLTTLPGIDDVSILAQHIARPIPCRHVEVGDAWRLLNDPVLAAADVAIFHWGIRYSLFDALSLRADIAPRTVVHFHNCTPPELVPAESRTTADESIRQIQLVADAGVDVWTFSEFNRRTLTSWGVDAARIAFVPFPIEPPRPLTSRRRADTFDIASVGRLVPAKGQHVLIEALPLLPSGLRDRTTVRIAGNSTFSESEYARGLVSMAGRLGVRDRIRFVGQPHDDDLWTLYESSHAVVSTSLHEGLCVPIIEGYLAGCRAVGTTAANLPFVVESPDPVVAPSDPDALAAALIDVADAAAAGERARPATVDAYGLASSRSRHADALGLVS